MIRITLIAALVATTAAGARPAEPLTIGSEAPKLAVKEFVRGEPVDGLRKGTVYVVEFSGTQCAPCIKCIPHLTELQKKHKDVVVISVYCHEGRKELGPVLAEHGDKIGYRVAVDPDAVMEKTWSDAAFRPGIPAAFIVDAKGTIAWIGHPGEMAEPLAGIVAGKFDPRADVLRLRLEQGAGRLEQEAGRKRRLAAEREQKARETYDRINAQIIGGKIADALAATEAALGEYADTTKGLDLFRQTKMYLLARRPETRDAAVEMAVELAVAAKAGRNVVQCLNLASSLLNAADVPAPKDRDQRLVDLAVALLRDTDQNLDLYTAGRPKGYVQQDRIAIRWRLAMAYGLRENYSAAVRQAEDAISLLKSLRPEASEDMEEFKNDRERQLADLGKDLARYKKLAESPPKDK